MTISPKQVKPLYIGIDPGLKGGIAILNEEGNLIKLVAMPLTKKNGKTKIDFLFINSLITSYSVDYILEIGIERQQAMRFGTVVQGVSSTFKTGYNYGYLLGILHEFQPIIVRACDWQNSFFGKKSQRKIKDTKANSAICAKKLFPKETFLATPRCSKIHDGLTDAILIAYYIKSLHK